MRDIDAVLPLFSTQVPGVSEPELRRAVVRAAIALCERTDCWRETDVFETDGRRMERLAIPPQATIHRFLGAWFDGRRLTPIPYERAMEIDGFRDGDGRSDGRPWAFTQPEPNALRLVPAGTGRLMLSVALKPGPDAEILPLWMIEDHAHTLADGALSVIFATPQHSDPERARYHRAAFDRALAERFACGVQGQQGARIRVAGSFL